MTGRDAERGAPAEMEEGREAREVGDREASGTLASGQDSWDGHLDGAGSVGWTAMQLRGHTPSGATGM